MPYSLTFLFRSREPKLSSKSGSELNSRMMGGEDSAIMMQQSEMRRYRRMENFESYCISLGVGPLWYS